MAHRLLAAIVVLSAIPGLTGCGGGEAPTSSGTIPPIAAQPTSEPAVQRDKAVGPAPADREVSEMTGFVSPSGNVSCMIDADWARCDIIDRDWSPPPRPADCEFDYGQGISLAPREPAQFVCAGDTAFGADEVLPYGESITAGALRCESAESWITCRDVHTGHGFSISREAYRLF